MYSLVPKKYIYAFICVQIHARRLFARVQIDNKQVTVDNLLVLFDEFMVPPRQLQQHDIYYADDMASYRQTNSDKQQQK